MATCGIPRGSVRRAATRLAVAVTVAAVAAAGLAATAAAQDRYTDVNSTHHGAHKDHIETLERLGVFDGTECGARKFCPTDPAKRWEVAVWIVRVVDGQDPYPVAKSSFADVKNSDWWMPYVERLYDLGITKGCKRSPLRYCPDDTVSRAQMASFLVRAFRLQRASSANFADTRGNHHEENIDALFAAGITIGCKSRPARFCPDRPATRAHMATFLNRGLINASGTIIRDGTGDGDTGGNTGGGNTGGNTGGTTPGATFPGSITTSQGTRSNDTQISATRGRTCAIRSDDTVTCWGGDEGFREHLAASDLDDVVAISISDHPIDRLHTCTVHDRGDVWCWGDGSLGQLGLNDTNTYHLPTQVPVSDAVGVAAGAGFTCVVHENTEVSCWGTNRLGQLGEGTTGTGREWPARVPRLFDIETISAGEDHVCGIHRDGELSCWGWVYGTRPTRVDTPDDVTSVSMGGIETCITVADGRVFCWDHGATTTDRMAQVANIRDGVKVSVGNDSACVLHLGGGVSCWGRNDVGQVGDGSTTRRSAPVRLTSITDAVDISVSTSSTAVGAHACVLHRNSTVSCWGSNQVGQLEDGTFTNRTSPTRIRLLTTVASTRIPFDATELLKDWLDTVVDERDTDFPWLRDAWDHIDSNTTATAIADDEGVVVDCAGASASAFVCDVTSMTIVDMSLENVVFRLAEVYDLHSGLSRPFAWGGAQLYFASRYSRCFSAEDQRGATAIAAVLVYVTVPHVWPSFEDRACARLPRTPPREAVRVVEQALDGDVPDWYDNNVTTVVELWDYWKRGPYLAALANLKNDFDGLCNIDWIADPWDPSTVPATAPFTGVGTGGSC